MPEVTGLELAKAIHEIRPDFPIVLMTGFSDTATSETVMKFGVSEFVMKPLITRDFIEAVKRAIGTNPVQSRERVASKQFGTEEREK
jgi:FixJ family two-component response regulator